MVVVNILGSDGYSGMPQDADTGCRIPTKPKVSPPEDGESCEDKGYSIKTSVRG